MKITKIYTYLSVLILVAAFSLITCTNNNQTSGQKVIGKYHFFLNPGSGEVRITPVNIDIDSTSEFTGQFYNLGIENSIDLQAGLLRINPENCSNADYNAASGILTASVKLLNRTASGGSICPTGAEDFCDENYLAPIELRIYSIGTSGICDTTCDETCENPSCIDTTVPPLAQTFEQADMSSMNHDSGCTTLADTDTNGYLDCMSDDPNFTYTNCPVRSGPPSDPYVTGECPEYTYHPTWDYTEKCDTNDASPSYTLEPSEYSGCKFLQFTFTHPDLDATHIPLLSFTADVLAYVDDGTGLDAPSVAAVTSPTNVSTQNIAVTIDTGDGADSVRITGGVGQIDCTDNDVCDNNPAAGTVTPTVTLNANTTNNLYVYQIQTTPIRISSATLVQIVHDSVAPQVSSTNPTTNEEDVSPGANIFITFSEPVSPSTVSASTILLYRGGTSITGAVSLSGDGYTATFNPSSSLNGSAIHTVSVCGTTGAAPCPSAVEDLAGSELANDYQYNFTTASSDSTPPTVNSTSPTDGASGVSRNTTVQINFSEPIDENTLTSPSDNIIIEDGSTTIAGDLTLSVNGLTATFSPNDPVNLSPAYEFDASTEYTVTVNSGSSGIKDLVGNALQTDYIFTFETGSGTDTTNPEVVSATPSNGATNVSEYVSPQVIFSEEIDPSTITGSNLFLKKKSDESLVPSTVSLSQDGLTATLDPSSALNNNTAYVLTIGEQIKDLAGNTLLSPQTVEFSTAVAVDTTAPSVVSVTPADEATDASPYTSVVITFSEPLDPDTVSTGTIDLGYYTGFFTWNNVPGTVQLSEDGYSAFFIQTNPPLGTNRVHYLTVTGGTDGVKDLAGNALAADFNANFRTGSDTTDPYAAGVAPSDGETSVPVNSNIIITFSEPVDADTVTGSNLYLSPSISGTVTLLSDYIHAKINPTGNLTSSTTYTVYATAGITDLAGRSLTASNTGFTTGTASDTSGPSVSSTDPTDESSGFERWQNLEIVFNEAVDPSTVSSNSIELIRDYDSSKVAANIILSEDSTTAIINPTNLLANNEDYTLNVKTSIRNLAGYALQSFTEVNFTSKNETDSTAPTVNSTDPVNGASGVPATKTVTVYMNESIDPDTAVSGIFRLQYRLWFWWVEVPVSVSIEDQGPSDPVPNEPRSKIIIDPVSNLNGGTNYQILIETDVVDDADNNMATQFTSGFST